MSYRIIDQTAVGKPDICVAMLTYNHGKYIHEALSSVFMQTTDFSYKVVLADDCSTDNTREILLDFQKKYPEKLKLIFQDENVGAAKNNLILHSNFEGKYIAALEGDDYWTDPLKLQKQVDFLEKNPDYSMCFHSVVNKFEDFSGVQEFTNLEVKTYSTYEILDSWVVPTASVVFRNYDHLFDSDSRILFGDIALFLALSKKGKIMCVSSEPMAVYRRVMGSATNRAYDEAYIKRLLLHNDYLKEIYGEEIKAITNKNDFELYFILFYKGFPKSPSFTYLKSSVKSSDNFLRDASLFLKNILIKKIKRL